MRIFLLWLIWLLSKIQICYFIFLLSGSNVASMSSFSSLEGVILTIPGGSVVEAMWWVGWSENWGIRLSFSPVQLKLSFGWAWKNQIKIFTHKVNCLYIWTKKSKTYGCTGAGEIMLCWTFAHNKNIPQNSSIGHSGS